MDSSAVDTTQTHDRGAALSTGYEVRISRPWLLRALRVIICVILLAHLSVHIYHYEVAPVSSLLKNAVDVDVEENFPTWYQGFSLLLAATLVLIIAARERVLGAAMALYWTGLGVVFVLLSVDEIAGYHETLNTLSTVSWTVPASIATAIFALAYVPFLLRIPRPTARRMVIAGAVYVGGAVGVEKLSDWFLRLDHITFDFPWGAFTIRHTMATLAHTLDYSISTAIEEGLEMLGVYLFVRTLLLYMSSQDKIVIPVRLDAPGSPAAPESAPR